LRGDPLSAVETIKDGIDPDGVMSTVDVVNRCRVANIDLTGSDYLPVVRPRTEPINHKEPEFIFIVAVREYSIDAVPIFTRAWTGG